MGGLMNKILAINPGATSTKIGVYADEDPLFVQIIRHEGNELEKFNKAIDQYQYRKNVILEELKKRNFNLKELSAVVGRGGTFKSLQGGVYQVNQKMLEDVKNGNVQAEHVSLIGCVLADEIAGSVGIPAYIVDPVSVDEFVDVYRVDISRYFDVGDALFCRVSKVTKHKIVQVSMKQMGTRKLREGIILHITPTKVARVIGKGGSMINLLKEKTGCEILVGQNGRVWIRGKNKHKVVEAILMIERESHTYGLTEKVRRFLEGENEKN